MTTMKDFTTAQDMNQHYLEMYRANLVGAIIDMWVDLAFKDKRLVLGGIPDEVVARFFLEAVEASNAEKHLPSMLTDYMVFGRLAAHLLPSSAKGYWVECINLGADCYSIKISPINQEPELSIEITQTQQEWASSTDPRVVEQREHLDPDMMRLMASGESIPLKPENTLFLARRVHSTDFYGTSWLSSVLGMTDETPAELLLALQVEASKIRDDRYFKPHYVEGAARLRDHICNYVFTEKMFPVLAKWHGCSLIPMIEWMDKENAEDPRNIVLRALEKTGVALDTLEKQQKALR